MNHVRITYIDKSLNFVLRQGKTQFSEGGFNHNVMNYIRKYGMVPESAYSGIVYRHGVHNHNEMSAVIESKVKTIISNPAGTLSAVWMETIVGILNTYIGGVPKYFVYKGNTYTLKSYCDFLGFNPDEYIAFTSFTHIPFYQPYILQVPDNWSNRSFYNLPLSKLMQVIDYALENGYTIAWDADISKKTWSRKFNVAIMPEVPYNKMTIQQQKQLFRQIVSELTPTQEKRQELFLDYRSTDNHLMHIVGTTIDQQENNYYLVKNSWKKAHITKVCVYIKKLHSYENTWYNIA